MKSESNPLKRFVMVLGILALLLTGWSVFSLRLGGLGLPQGAPAILFLLAMAVFLELTAVQLPSFGYASLAYCVYFTLLIRFDYSFMVLVATLALLGRQTLRNKDDSIIRIGEFSINIISLALSGIVFSVLNLGSRFLCTQNLVAMALSAVAYYALFFYLVKMLVSLMDQEVQITQKVILRKVMPILMVLAPLGAVAGVLFSLNPVLSILAFLPLYPLHYNLTFGMREMAMDSALIKQEELQQAVDQLKHSLNIYKDRNKELSIDFYRKVDELSILFELSQSLGTSVNLDSILQIIITKIKKLMHYQSCVIFLINQGDITTIKGITPYHEILEYSSLLKLEETVVKMVIENKKPVLITEFQTTGEHRIFKDEKSLICAPLMVKNEIIGVIYVGARRPGSYNEDHLHLLSIIGNAASSAIKTSQLFEEIAENYEQVQKLNEKMNYKVRQSLALLDLGQFLGSSLNMDETLRIIMRGMGEMFNYQTGAVFLVQKTSAGACFIPRKFITPYEKIFENFQIPMDDKQNMMGWVAENKKSLLLVNTKDTRLQTILGMEKSLMVVPLIVENSIIGAIYLGHSKPDFFNEEALELLRNVAYLSAMAIRNAELYEKTATMAITDGLTGLYTHRYFQERLSEEIKSAQRYGKKLALLMIDADKFKQYNDTLGHPEGDKVLKEFAAVLKAYTRDSDLVCRIGGDEFIVLMKEVEKKDAVQKAEGIRQTIRNRFFDRPVQVTSSIGLACFPEDAADKPDFVKAADEALYVSKNSGRNRVSVAPSLNRTAGTAVTGTAPLNPGVLSRSEGLEGRG